MADEEKKSKSLAIFFVERSGDINIYDLITKDEEKKICPTPMKNFLTLGGWKQFFQDLSAFYPSKNVKSLVCDTVIDSGNPTNSVFFKDVKDVAYDYEDFEKDGANYFTSDFLKKSGIDKKDIRFCFIDIDSILEGRHYYYHGIIQSIFHDIEHFEFNIKGYSDSVRISRSTKYLAKLYSGEEYNKHYNYYVGNICEYKLELEVNESMIELPVQFKRLPCTIEKKIEIKLAKNFKVRTVYYLKLRELGTSAKGCKTFVEPTP
uniref:DUF3800 domain-containing protein n=1 Tax=Panagrolaimus sp. JU765 TaxID=591449 RepID=A0AC34PZ16_9BILA